MEIDSPGRLSLLNDIIARVEVPSLRQSVKPRPPYAEITVNGNKLYVDFITCPARFLIKLGRGTASGKNASYVLCYKNGGSKA